MRLIVDAFYCKRKIIKMQTTIEPELVEIPRRKLNRAPQTGPSNSMTDSVDRNCTNWVIWLGQKNSIFWNNSSLRILSKQYNSITTQINAILVWLPIYRTRTFIWSNSPDYKNFCEKLGRLFALDQPRWCNEICHSDILVWIDIFTFQTWLK